MNPQTAIEAARIAAETAARNAWITTIVTVIALLITSGISIWSVMRNSKITKELGEGNLKSLKQKRYIDAISVERVKWINTMRDRFSEYIKLVHIQMNDFDKWKSQGDKDIDDDELRKRYFEITSVNNQINFLLNQTEPIVKKLVKIQFELTSELSLPEDISEFNYQKLQNMMEDLGYFYQVVLKAEWKRVKEEIKKGEEIDDDGMNNIYLSAAKKLSEEFYNKHLIELES